MRRLQRLKRLLKVHPKSPLIKLTLIIKKLTYMKVNVHRMCKVEDNQPLNFNELVKKVSAYQMCRLF